MKKLLKPKKLTVKCLLCVIIKCLKCKKLYKNKINNMLMTTAQSTFSNFQ